MVQAQLECNNGFPASSRGWALRGGVRGWVPACARTTGGDGFSPASSWGWDFAGGYGDGSPHARGQRVGMDSCLRLHGGGTCAGGTGMGPRMREDNGWGWILACVFTGVGPVRGVRGWVPACARTTGGDGFLPASSWGWALCGGYGDGSPHPRGQRVGMDSCLRLHGGGTCAGGYGDGSPHARGQRVGMDSCLRFHGGGLCAGGTGMGPRMREDKGGDGFSPASSRGQALCGGVRGWVPACARTMGGDGFLPASSRGWDLCGGVRGWVPACARTTGGDGFLPASSRGGYGDGSACARTTGRGWK